MDPQVMRNFKAALRQAKFSGDKRGIAYYREALAKAQGSVRA